MARRDTSARRYAEAAFQTGRADGTLDAWERDMAILGATLRHPELRALLQHPAVPFAEKERVLRRVLGRGVAPAAVNLVLLMVRRGRPGAIDRMIARFAELLRRERGIVLARGADGAAARRRAAGRDRRAPAGAHRRAGGDG